MWVFAFTAYGCTLLKGPHVMRSSTPRPPGLLPLIYEECRLLCVHLRPLAVDKNHSFYQHVPRNIKGPGARAGERSLGRAQNDKFLIRLFPSWSFKEYDLAHVPLRALRGGFGAAVVSLSQTIALFLHGLIRRITRVVTRYGSRGGEEKDYVPHRNCNSSREDTWQNLIHRWCSQWSRQLMIWFTILYRT